MKFVLCRFVDSRLRVMRLILIPCVLLTAFTFIVPSSSSLSFILIIFIVPLDRPSLFSPRSPRYLDTKPTTLTSNHQSLEAAERKKMDIKSQLNREKRFLIRKLNQLKEQYQYNSHRIRSISERWVLQLLNLSLISWSSFFIIGHCSVTNSSALPPSHSSSGFSSISTSPTYEGWYSGSVLLDHFRRSNSLSPLEPSHTRC